AAAQPVLVQAVGGEVAELAGGHEAGELAEHTVQQGAAAAAVAADVEDLGHAPVSAWGAALAGAGCPLGRCLAAPLVASSRRGDDAGATRSCSSSGPRFQRSNASITRRTMSTEPTGSTPTAVSAASTSPWTPSSRVLAM